MFVLYLSAIRSPQSISSSSSSPVLFAASSSSLAIFSHCNVHMSVHLSPAAIQLQSLVEQDLLQVHEINSNTSSGAGFDPNHMTSIELPNTPNHDCLGMEYQDMAISLYAKCQLDNLPL